MSEKEKKKATYAAAAGVQWKVVENRRRTPRGPSAKVWRPELRSFELPRDLARPSQLGRASTSEDIAKRNTIVQALSTRRSTALEHTPECRTSSSPRVGSTGARLDPPAMPTS